MRAPAPPVPAVIEPSEPDFGSLLRGFRTVARLSQEALAERARMGVETVSALERGFRRAPYRATVDRLADALGLSDPDRTALERAAERAGRVRQTMRPNLTRIHALASPDGVPSNIPLPVNPLIGRATIVGELVALLATARLVSLIGAGGVGKTRVALQVARQSSTRFPDGLCFIDLGQIADGGLVAATAATALGLRQSAERPTNAMICAALARRRMLLVVDCCEHVIDDAAAFADAVLGTCPNVRIIATTREPLKTAGEHRYHLAPLEVPPPGARLDAAAALAFGAVEFFIDRTRAADSTFVLRDADADAVADVCRRLDGIALAIELAAARMKTLGLPVLMARLERRLSLLTTGDRTAPPRHRTLRALLDWSYDLLTEPERVVLRRVAVFAGGWTLDAAETVCGDAPLEPSVVTDALAGLADKSLVVCERESGGVRHRLLDATREYALEKLDASGERDTVAARHAGWFAAFFADSDLAGWSEPIQRWLPPMAAELNNARAALRWALGPPNDTYAAGVLAASFGTWGYSCGLVGEARNWIDAALERAQFPADLPIAARLWLALGTLTTGARRVDVCERAGAVFRATGDLRRLAASAVRLGGGYCQIGNYASADATLEAARELLRASGYTRSSFYAIALSRQGSALAALGRHGEARALLLEAIGIFADLGDDERAANERVNLAEIEFAGGAPAVARAIVAEAIEILQTESADGFRLADSFVGIALQNAAAYALVLGDLADARAAAHAALVEAQRAGFPNWIAVSIQHLATVAALRGELSDAALLCGWCDAVFARDGVTRGLTEARGYDLLRAAVAVPAHEPGLRRLTADGASLTQAEAIAIALAID